MTLPPFIVNLAPSPDELNTGLTAPIRFSVRDADSFVAPSLIRLTLGYAKVRASGTQAFDLIVPRTAKSSITFGVIDDTPATIVHVTDGMRVTKTVSNPQKSTYVTSLDSGSGYRPVLAMAEVEPVTITNGQPGAVFGLENGPRRTAVYVIFERSGGTPRIRFCGPANAVGTRAPNLTIAKNWTGLKRYFILWNELRSTVELYCIDGGATSLLHEEPISSFQPFDLEHPGGTPRRGGDGDMTMVYGIEGQTGEATIIGNVALTLDVGFPLAGLVRTGEYQTIRQSDESIRYEGGDPIKNAVSAWFGPDDTFFTSPDPLGVVRVLSDNEVRLTKMTSGDSFAVYRQEPGFLDSAVDGFVLDVDFFGITTQLLSSRITGMGFMIFDGTTVWYVGLLSGSANTIGILRSGGGPGSLSSYILPNTNVDWSSPTSLRFTVDPRRNLVELFWKDYVTPVLSTVLNRAAFPNAASFGLSSQPAFIAFGHIAALNTLGSLDVSRLVYSTRFEAFEARDGVLPDNAASHPQWTSTLGGFGSGTPSPLYGLALLGGGFGILPVGLYIGSSFPPTGVTSIVDDQLVINGPPKITQTFSLNVPFSPDRGGIIEFRTQITRHKPRARSGFYVIIDDGFHTFALSFVDTEIGKFVAFPIRSGSGLVEIVGTEGPATKLSAKIDWDSPHIYRFERRPLDGTYLFIDGATTPTLYIADSDRTVDIPLTSFSTPTAAFGHLSGEGATSLTDFVHVMYSEGYEISTKKVDSTDQLEQDIRNTQAMVLAFVEDADS